MRLDIAAQTDTGRRKKNNEDYYGVFDETMAGRQLFDEGALLCVADGLGGHTGGEIASKLAVSYVKEALKKPPQRGGEGGENGEETGPIPILRESFRKANESIYQTNVDFVRDKRPMGTTLLAALITPGKAYVLNVGDSRAFLVRKGQAVAQTEDHSWVDEQVKQGLMSKEEAETDERRNLVTRSIGTQPEVEADSYEWDIQPGDMLLLCTDGLINMVDEADIIAEVNRPSTPAEIVSHLVEQANTNGGKDNITLALAHISPGLGRLYYLRWLRFWRDNKLHICWLLACLFVGAAAFIAGNFLGLFVP
ncbi:MAG: Stp1/IreP family PP2C-type Ser/Thr phosphatase [Candidatus Hydrogenedentota bacterium]